MVYIPTHREQIAMDGEPQLQGLIDVTLAYLTTDWKRGEVRRVANWLSEEE
jgi:hypothetical protein